MEAERPPRPPPAGRRAATAATGGGESRSASCRNISSRSFSLVGSVIRFRSRRIRSPRPSEHFQQPVGVHVESGRDHHGASLNSGPASSVPSTPTNCACQEPRLSIDSGSAWKADSLSLLEISCSIWRAAPSQRQAAHWSSPCSPLIAGAARSCSCPSASEPPRLAVDRSPPLRSLSRADVLGRASSAPGPRSAWRLLFGDLVLERLALELRLGLLHPLRELVQYVAALDTSRPPHRSPFMPRPPSARPGAASSPRIAVAISADRSGSVAAR